MKTIWKFPFEIRDEFTLEMPISAEILHVDTQGGVPCIWAAVRSDREMGTFRFLVRGTGHDCEEVNTVHHVGSFLMHGGALVFHLFRDFR